MRAHYVGFLFLLVGSTMFTPRGASAATQTEVVITSPSDGTATNAASIEVEIAFRSELLPVEEVSLAVDGELVDRAPVMPPSMQGAYVFHLDLAGLGEGSHKLQAFATTTGHFLLEPLPWELVPHDAASEPVSLLVDRTPPAVEILSPPDGSMHEEFTIAQLTGTTSDSGSGLASVFCNEHEALVSADTFACDVYLVRGENGIWVNVADNAGNRTSVRQALIGVGRPLATLQTAQGDEDSTIELFLEGSDPAGGTLAATITSLPVDGELRQADGTPITGVPAVVAGDGRTVRFQPEPDENGAPYDSFAYMLTSSVSALSSDQRTVSVDVSPVNDPPRVWSLRVTTDEDTDLTFEIPFEDPDLEREGDTVTRYVKYNVSGSRGSLHQVNSDGTPGDRILSTGFVEIAHPDGLLFYRPKPDDFGNAVDGFSHLVQDAAGVHSEIMTGWIDIRSVNDAPVGRDASIDVTNGDEQIRWGSMHQHYSDVDNDPLDLVMSRAPTNGTLYREFEETHVAVGEDPSEFVYYVAHAGDCADPIPHGTPLDSMEFTVTDPDGASDSFTLTINVTHVDTRAVATGPFHLNVANPGGSVEFSIAASDAEDDHIRVKFEELPLDGVLERQNLVGDWKPVTTGTNVGIESDDFGPTMFRYRLNEGEVGPDSFEWNVETWHFDDSGPPRRDSRCGPYTTTVETSFAPAG